MSSSLEDEKELVMGEWPAQGITSGQLREGWEDSIPTGYIICPYPRG